MANYAIDYTSRDFDSLKNDLITVIQTRLSANGKVWEAKDPADFGLALVEAFAYVGDITNYYIDRVANESFLPTAVQRSSVLKLARSMNYSPSGFSQAEVELTVTNSLDEVVTIPAGTQFAVTVPTTSSSSTRLLFSTNSEYPILASSDGTTSITVSHGEEVSLRAENLAQDSTEIDGEYLTRASTGYANQSYNLLVGNPVDSTIKVFVDESGSYVEWTRVLHLYDHGPSASVYEVEVNEDNSATIKFGDGISGAVPAFGSEIRAQYSVVSEGGSVGNVPANLPTWEITAVPSFTVELSDLTSALSFANPDPGFGGSDPESNDSIRENAPRVLSTINRAVTLNDFAYLALSVGGVGSNKATAYANNPNSVVVYVAPENTVSNTSFFPGYTEDLSEVTYDLANLIQGVSSFLEDKVQIGTDVTVLPAEYMPMNLALKYRTPEGVNQTVLESSLTRAVFAGFGYDNMTFNTPIFPEQIEQVLTQTSLASLVKVTALYSVEDGTYARNVVIPTTGVIPIFTDKAVDGVAGIELYPWASLRGITLSAGTLSTTFDTRVLSYTTTTTGTTVTVTPVKVSSDDVVTITIDGAPSADGVVSIPSVGTKTVSIKVVSADGLETATYTLAVVKTA